MGKYFVNFDWLTAITLLCLGSFGLFLLLTLGTPLFVSQFGFIIIAFILLTACSLIDPVLLLWFAPFGYVLGIIFLGLSYLGPSIRGATRWLVLGGIQLQPSELAKPLFLLAFAYFFTKFSPRNTRNIPLLFVLFIVPFLLVFKQPDLGSSLVYASFWLAMLLGGGLPIGILVLLAAGFGVLLPISWEFLVPYQRARILTFLNPSLDPQGAGYNALQSMIAVGSGQLFGRGLGRGTQSHLRFLPEYHTDFIFATLIEELGFIGGALLLAGYAYLLSRIIMPLFGRYAQDPVVFIYSIGLFAMLLSQIFINAGMNMGLIPITGITLPFVSYGGSSILSTAVCVGVLWALRSASQTARPIAIG